MELVGVGSVERPVSVVEGKVDGQRSRNGHLTEGPIKDIQASLPTPNTPKNFDDWLDKVKAALHNPNNGSF